MSRTRIHLAIPASRRIDADTMEHGTRPACFDTIVPSHRVAKFQPHLVNCPKCRETDEFREEWAKGPTAHEFREGADFDNHSGALTLSPDINGTHDSGWTVDGEVHEDYFSWVNEFTATHPKHGRVAGDFESVVKADTAEGFAHFMKHHPPEAWDYADI